MHIMINISIVNTILIEGEAVFTAGDETAFVAIFVICSIGVIL